MNPHFQRALMLFDQSRYELAEQELKQSLAAEPDDASAHALLGLCLAERKEYDRATGEIQTAIGLSPELPFAFYAQSIVCAKLNHVPEAEGAILEAIGLDPFDPAYFAQLASVLFEQRRWQEAADAARQGLALDPEHVACTNLHAMALVKLGKRTQAGEAIATALKRAPEDSNTHANMGWTKLEASRPREAMEHFREALRLDPNNEWARTGIIEAMKARNVVYRLLLGWFLWMMKLTGRTQWFVIVGAYAGYQVLRTIAKNNPTLAPWIFPVLVAYFVFAVATWIASPLFNLILRLDRFGRLALNREERITSNWVGLCVLGALISLVAYFVTSRFELLGCAIASIAVVLPLSRVYACHEGWPRVAVVGITIALALLAATMGVLLTASMFTDEATSAALGAVALSAFLTLAFGALASQFGLNALIHVRPRHGGISTRQAWLICVGLLVAGAAVFAVKAVGVAREAYAHAKDQRTKVVRADDIAWQNPDLVNRETASLEQIGFQQLGDYKFIPVWASADAPSDAHIRLFLHADQTAIAELLESPKIGVICFMLTYYADGRKFGLINGTTKLPKIPNRQIPGATAAELYRQMIKERPKANIHKSTAEEILRRCEETGEASSDGENGA